MFHYIAGTWIARVSGAPAPFVVGGKETMSVIVWILFGFVVGVIAKLLMPGRDPGGFFVTIFLGIAGSFVGGFIGRALGLYRTGQHTAGWILSVIGAITILAIYRLIARRRTFWRP